MIRQHIPWEPSDEGGPLGRSVEHDPASRAFQAVGATTRKHVLWGRHGPIFDQDIGSCTGEATVGAAITTPTYRPHHNYRQPMALKVYSLATKIDGFPGEWPPTDTGSSGLAACKAAVQLGLIGSYQHAFGIDQALDALQVRPVITGVKWYEGFDTPDKDGRVKIDGQVRGGHEFVIVEYDPGDGTPSGSWVKAANSWSNRWGPIGGYFWMRVSDWATLLADQGDVTVPVK